MYYTVYKTTNKINNKEYIGIHKTKKADDYYLGSGKLLKQAIKKYSRKNFTKEILFIFDNEKEMKDKELEIVNEEYIKRNDTYNLTIGGYGGQTCKVNKGFISAKTKEGNFIRVKASDVRFISGELVGVNKNNSPSNETKLKLANAIRGKIRSAETREKMSIAAKLRWSKRNT